MSAVDRDALRAPDDYVPVGYWRHVQFPTRIEWAHPLTHEASVRAFDESPMWERVYVLNADELAALRARPTLDRETLLATFEQHGGVDWLATSPGELADAILAAVGQDTPEPEWTDTEPWITIDESGNPYRSRYGHADGTDANGIEWEGWQHKPRTRPEYDTEQGT